MINIFIPAESAFEKEYQKKYEGVDIESLPDRVAETYEGKTLLVTGGTGFMGKVLLEKVLRSFVGVKKIYLLMRVKKGEDPKDRIYKVFQNPVISYFIFALQTSKLIILIYNNI